MFVDGPGEIGAPGRDSVVESLQIWTIGADPAWRSHLKVTHNVLAISAVFLVRFSIGFKHFFSTENVVCSMGMIIPLFKPGLSTLIRLKCLRTLSSIAAAKSRAFVMKLLLGRM